MPIQKNIDFIVSSMYVPATRYGTAILFLSKDDTIPMCMY